MNASYLSELFKEVTGMTFTEFITKHRLQKAKELLKDSNKKIYEISDAVGYRNVKYFSQLFRKTVGIQPLEYRELLR